MNRPIIERTDDAPETLDTEILDETIPNEYCEYNVAGICFLTGLNCKGCSEAKYDYIRYMEDMR